MRRKKILARVSAFAVPIFLAVFFVLGCATTPAPEVLSSDFPEITVPPGRWIRGDFHCHSTYSDGDTDLADVISHAEKTGLGFFVVTDHDTGMDGRTPHWKDPAYTSSRLTLLHGVEWTSALGHANLFSSEPFDYAPLWEANREGDAASALQEARRQGVFFSVNHPSTPGCTWEYELRDVDFVEIWNGPFEIPSKNGKTISEFWEPILLSGKRMPGIGGSDNHQLKGFQKHFNSHGYPTTWVYVGESRKQAVGEAVLKSVSAGRVSLSYCPEADRLEFYADTDGNGSYESMMGDVIPSSDIEISFLARIVPVSGPEGEWHRQKYTLHVYKNGEKLCSLRLREDHAPFVVFTDVPGERAFYRLELHGTVGEGLLQALVMGNTLAVTNPIYAGYEQ